MREAPAAFVAEMRRKFADFRDVRWNEQVGRWEFVFLSAMNRECSQFLGWSHNPLTGETIEPDPVSGLLPMRELDVEAQAYVIASCEKTYIGNPVDGASSWAEHFRKGIEHNKRVHLNRRRAQTDDFAYAMQQVDLRKPWVKEHPRSTKKQYFTSKSSQPAERDLVSRGHIEVVSTFRSRKENAA